MSHYRILDRALEEGLAVRLGINNSNNRTAFVVDPRGSVGNGYYHGCGVGPTMPIALENAAFSYDNDGKSREHRSRRGFLPKNRFEWWLMKDHSRNAVVRRVDAGVEFAARDPLKPHAAIVESSFVKAYRAGIKLSYSD